MESATHHAFVPCPQPDCGSAGMVSGSATGQAGETVTIVSEGTCPAGHKLTQIATTTL